MEKNTHKSVLLKTDFKLQDTTYIKNLENAYCFNLSKYTFSVYGNFKMTNIIAWSKSRHTLIKHQSTDIPRFPPLFRFYPSIIVYCFVCSLSLQGHVTRLVQGFLTQTED